MDLKRFGKFLFMLVAAWQSALAETSQSYFGRTQSLIQEFQGVPLISANWEGRFRPYLYAEGKFKTLLTEEQLTLYEQTDFFNPIPINANHFFIYGEEVGKKYTNLFVFNATTKKLTQLSANSNTNISAYHNMCVAQDKYLVSYPTQQFQDFYKINLESLSLEKITPAGRIPRFENCMWINDTELLGVARSMKGFHLFKCQMNKASIMQCGHSNVLASFKEFVQLFKDKNGKPGVLGLKAGEQFRKPYIFSDNFQNVQEVSVPTKLSGDILELHDDAVRVGLEGRYQTSLTDPPEPDVIISQFKKVANKWYAIAADNYHGRTLAQLENNSWKLTPYFPMPPADSILAPVEIWTKSATGDRYQSFYYGPPNAKKIIIWLHGGPKESFSPRFHPYAYNLNKMGYGFLAVNYPGSTGRGLAYEQQLDTKARLACMQSVFNYLKEREALQVIVWSISFGDKLQKEMLENNFPISAMVDQVGILPAGSVAKLAQDKNVPYFSIRGKYDPASAATTADFFYEGGHDITYYKDYDLLLTKIAPFLAAAKPWTY